MKWPVREAIGIRGWAGRKPLVRKAEACYVIQCGSREAAWCPSRLGQHGVPHGDLDSLDKMLPEQNIGNAKILQASLEPKGNCSVLVKSLGFAGYVDVLQPRRITGSMQRSLSLWFATHVPCKGDPSFHIGPEAVYLTHPTLFPCGCTKMTLL